jgi:N-acetylmuramoyl-L-alanine amidase
MVELHAKGAKPATAAVIEEPAPPIVETTVAAKVVAATPVLPPISRPSPGAATANPAPRKSELPEPKAASRNANGDRTLTRALGLKLGRVVLDPGHGGHDVGTHGPSGLFEKDLVLDVSQRLAVLLQDRLGSEVLLYCKINDMLIRFYAKNIIWQFNLSAGLLSIYF